jgi:pimeloyl-ACP methyl ester carboxylesterase
VRRRWTLLWILFLAPFPAARADVLVPRHGRKVEGAIVSRTGDQVVFNIYWSRNPGVTNPDDLVRLPMSKVRKLEEEPHPEVEFFRRLAKAKTADELAADGDYAHEHKLRGRARMAYALALAKDDENRAAIKGIGGRTRWASERKGNPMLDADLQGLLARYATLDDVQERVKLQKSIAERGFKAKPWELERYRRSALQPKGYQRDRPICYRCDDTPGAVYTLYVPRAYTPARPWPLLIGLHGGGPDGKAGDEVVGSGPSAMMFYQRHADKWGMIVACPTAPTAPWSSPAAKTLVHNVIRELELLYHVDVDRVYLTGHSMGGFGTWSLGPEMAEELAAISPMAGAGRGGISRLVSTHTPIFIYHSDNDPVVGVASDRASARQLLGTDLDFVYTELPGQGHGFPASVQEELFAFLSPRRRYDAKYKEAWPRSSFVGKPTKDEITYLGDPMDAIRGVKPDLDAWIARLELGGGCARAAATRIVERKPEGAVARVVKVLEHAKLPFDARAEASRALGLLGDAGAAPALRRAVAEAPSHEQSRVAVACARALVALKDATAPSALARAVTAWTGFAEDKRMGRSMRFSDWQRASEVLVELVGAWDALATPDADASFLDKTIVARVFAPDYQVATSKRVPQDPSARRTALAEAIARAYKRTNASKERWGHLLAALEKDPKARAAAEALKP